MVLLLNWALGGHLICLSGQSFIVKNEHQSDMKKTHVMLRLDYVLKTLYTILDAKC